ncbi:MAG: ribonuclease Z [Flavobacteriales bacterium]|nr:ribonuclease Z [Flavobacteriales bacterium]
MVFEVTTLGTGAALPARGRYPTAQLLNVRDELYLIDCGEGTQERLRMAGVNFNRIGRIFISHLHGDHYLGLMGLLSSMHLQGRLRELHVHGPADLREVVHLQLRVSQTYLRYPLQIHAVASVSGEVIMEDERVTVTALALKHRLPCTGLVVKERATLRSLRKEMLPLIPAYRRTGVKEGADLVLEDGTVIPNAELTLDPPAQRSYAFCSDTAYAPELVPFLTGVDLLYHEATFTEALLARAKETLHSTARQAATIARDADVGTLLLGHFSSRYKSADLLLQEALPVFPRTLLSNEGATFKVGPRG